MIASLPMYDWPETRQATDRWWHAVAGALGVDMPLTRQSEYMSLWNRTDLLFSQTCGYPFTHAFAGKLTLVATPHYAVDGCQGPLYQSIIFARDHGPLESFRGRIAAVNNADSMSGMLAMKLVFAPLAEQGLFFREAIETGGHVNSMIAVRDGQADVCAIDAVCVALARRYRPDLLDGLSEVARSPMVPGLPYVTVCGDVARLRHALGCAFSDPDLQETRDQLFLSGFSVLTERDYASIISLEHDMQQSGGLKLL